ncbi:MAG: hypothetical protein A2687_02060 [Candidatus Levybacteria bacterium RIFCSPHIGHO2_01_FULL_38_26]|nr:MAG: hypothetical protein A2687_02060 [Candidatus Levybacteria bacterium RIFCSPHIGHO2_01_FULL_38_26]
MEATKPIIEAMRLNTIAYKNLKFIIFHYCLFLDNIFDKCDYKNITICIWVGQISPPKADQPLAEKINIL